MGLSQSELADEIGCDQKTISRWERGENEPGSARDRAMEVLRAFKGDIAVDDQWKILVRFHRQLRGLTQNDLADLIGADITAISRWERGVGIPDRHHQVMLRDLILQPLSASGDYKRIAQQVARSEDYLALSYGPKFLVGSRKSNERNAKLGIVPGMDWPNFYRGRLMPMYDQLVRTRALVTPVLASLTGKLPLNDGQSMHMTSVPIILEGGHQIFVTRKTFVETRDGDEKSLTFKTVPYDTMFRLIVYAMVLEMAQPAIENFVWRTAA